MKALAPLTLILIVASIASAEPISGVVDHVSGTRDGAPDSVTLTSDGTQYRITDPEMVRTLFWLERERVVLEGTVGARGEATEFTVSTIVEPAFKQVEGVLYKTKSGFSGSVRIAADGKDLRVTGPNYRNVRATAKDMQRRDVVVKGFVLKDEIVVTHLQATAKNKLTMTEGAILGHIQDVPAGETVWIRDRGLLGATSKIETNEGVVGRVLTDNLQIGSVITDASADASADAGANGADSGDQADARVDAKVGAVGALRDR